jgi:hypothetical protein
MSKRKHYRPFINPRYRPDTRPNYRKIIEAAITAGTLSAEPGTVSVLEIQHDLDCAIYQGEPCDCDPAIIQNPPFPPDNDKKSGQA